MWRKKTLKACVFVTNVSWLQFAFECRMFYKIFFSLYVVLRFLPTQRGNKKEPLFLSIIINVQIDSVSFINGIHKYTTKFIIFLLLDFFWHTHCFRRLIADKWTKIFFDITDSKWSASIQCGWKLWNLSTINTNFKKH